MSSSSRAIPESFMDYVIKHDPYGIAVLDNNLHFLFVSERFLEDYQFSNEDVIGKHHYEVFPQIPEKWKKVHQLVLKGEVINANDDIFIRQDGTVEHTRWECRPWKQSDGSIGGIIVYTEMITEKIELEKKRKEAFELIKNLASQVPGVIYQYRLYPDGRTAFPFSSDGMYDIYELTPEDVKEDASAVLSRLHPDDVGFVMDAIYESAKKQTLFQCKFRVVLPVKGLRWRQSNATPQLLDDGSTLWHGIITDITDEQYKEELLKQRNEELIFAKEKAEESNRLKTEFLNNMSHEIRTPLNGIIGFSEMLKDKTLSNVQTESYTDIIQSSSYQLLKIVEDILEISAIGTNSAQLSEEVFELNELLDVFFSCYNRPASKKGISLILEKGIIDQHTYIQADKSKLSKILTNLLENALKFTDYGSVSFGYNIEDDRLVLYVKDTGVGISPEYIDRVFDRFSQEQKELSRKHGGLGLGLALSRENAKIMGGDISVESVKGKGSIFFVNIPYKIAGYLKQGLPVLEPDIREDNVTSHSGKRLLTVLIAEDEEVNYLYLDTLLRLETNFEFRTIRALNGKEAVDACSHNDSIDIVLMDLKMPVMSGHEAAVIIKTLRPGIKIIAQTAYSSNFDKNLALKNGFDDFISKPINKEILLSMIGNYV
ncbi:MAG: ATP-binding protein [Bacteroidales bacterium]